MRVEPRHETEIGVRFAGADKLVHLISSGEASPRRWWVAKGFESQVEKSSLVFL